MINPKPPYQRIMQSPHISESVKTLLKNQYDLLNPFELRKAIERKLKNIFNLHYNKQRT